jgi:hypothetical protein
MLKRFLTHRFAESWTKHVEHFHRRTNDGTDFVFVQQVRHEITPYSRPLRPHPEDARYSRIGIFQEYGTTAMMLKYYRPIRG